MATSPTPAEQPAKKDAKTASFALVDLGDGFTKRQIRIPTPTYDGIQTLAVQIKKSYAPELNGGKFSLEEVLVMAVQAGLVALAADPHAPRSLP